MVFTQKIYFNNKPMILTNDSAGYIHQHKAAEGYLLLKGAFTRNFRLATEHLSRLTSMGAIIEDISHEALLQELHKQYIPIDAAGGVVYNEDDNVLMIYRRGKWDLPKGKRDDDEDMTTCALREVAEETGLKNLSIQDTIGNTYHIYDQGGIRLLKTTSWFLMSGTKNETLIPQKEENISEVKWVSEKQMTTLLYKSYEAIRTILSSAAAMKKAK